MRSITPRLAALLVAAAPLAAAAIDAPHDLSVTSGNCQGCHSLHNATGNLINKPTDNDTCTTCHNAVGTARLGLPWATTDQASPGVSGSHHRWDGFATNATYGALPPQDAQMAVRTAGGKIECSTCHDQHAANAAFLPNALHTSWPLGVAQARTGPVGAGAATMTLVSVAAGALPDGYRVQYVAAGRIALTHTAKRASPAWLKPSVATGASWVADTAAPVGGAFNATFTLDDLKVTVSIAGTPAVGDFWDLYVSYPHLRASNVADAMCLDCHRSRNQTFQDVRGTGTLGAAWTGATPPVFSHPVGQALNANAVVPATDLAAPLDATGVAQATGDGNTTNDLALDAGLVRCTTCHAVHNADSNSLTVDPR